ncbi:CAP domain-containing protein [Austwickia chelonae]|uniref:CAP domain-containing protein n=1 Tax=Austwickia chelonae TaxID=100225 RepID=UPI0013C2BD23|nr:CAP domain-containing protein [Austwickia chelonae]
MHFVPLAAALTLAASPLSAAAPVAHAAPTAPAAAPVVAASSDMATMQEVVRLTNEQRAANGAGPVVWNTCLQTYSEKWSDTIARQGSLSHQQMTAIMSGCKQSTASENVAMGYQSSKAVVDGWMSSPGHRKNMLNPTFDQISIAMTASPSGTKFWVMNLSKGPGSPLKPGAPAAPPKQAPVAPPKQAPVAPPKQAPVAPPKQNPSDVIEIPITQAAAAKGMPGDLFGAWLKRVPGWWAVGY